MFRLILNIVKRILGHDDLIVLFLSKIELNEELKSIFAACCDITACCEMFKCVTEAVVQSDDLTRQKHEQQSLIEVIFHDQETIDILEYMDVKFFNETISPLRNVYDWIQCLLQVDSCKGLKQLLKFFLDKFNDDQVSALVSVITHKIPHRFGERRRIRLSRLHDGTSSTEWASPSGNVYTISAASLTAIFNKLIIKSNLIF